MAGSEWSGAIAVAAFVASYVGLGLGRVPPFRVDRTGVAIIGATLMVVSGALPWPDAVAAVDAPTRGLLFGMMSVTGYLRLSGFFRLVMTWALRRARTPLALLAAVVTASGVLSAFFVNDVVCLVLAPVVLEITRQLALPPVPYLLALATAANVGSVATLTGNPQNMLVGSFSEISYRSFLAREAPVAVLGLGCVFLVVWVVYRRQLPQAPLAIVPDTRLAVHYPLMLKTVVAIAVMLVAFLAGVPIAIVAIAGAGCTLLPRRGWLVLAMASTLAGNLTILGSVANLIVVETARAARVEIGFVEYSKVGVPLTLVTLLLGWLLLAFLPV